MEWQEQPWARIILGLGDHVHYTFVALGPVTFGEAVHQEDVDVINAKLFAEAVEVGTHAHGIARPGFRQHSGFVSRDVLQCLCHVGMTSIGISSVKEAQAVVIAIQQQVRKALDSERGLVGMMADAYRPGAHGKTAGVDTSVAEGDCVGGGELLCELGRRPGVAAESCSEPGGS